MRPDLRYGLAVLVVTAVLLAVFVDVPGVASLRREYAGTGLFGALEFALAYALLSLLPLPATVITLAAGAVFGLARGLLIVVLGATLGRWPRPPTWPSAPTATNRGRCRSLRRSTRCCF